MYNEIRTDSYEPDECLVKGICPVNPTLSSIHEIILLYIKELSFYVLKLKDFGMINEKVKEIIIYAFFNIVTNAEYNQEQFHDLIEKLYDNIVQSKAMYEKVCHENNAEIQIKKSYFKYSKSFDLTDAIRRGEKYFLKKSHTYSPKEKDLYDIMLFLSKSIIIKIVELQSLGESFDDAYYAVLSLLDFTTPGDFSEEKIKEKIEQTVKIYYNIVKEVFNAQTKAYGNISQTEVSFSTQPGKAILVSGTDLSKLEMVLKATENKEINVYTHGLEMLMAHAFTKLRSHPNLKGHYGTGLDSSLIDFASFPGAILFTKGTLQRIEYLYRGRLFTIDPIAPLGVVKIKNDDFEPLIKSALEAKGFSRAEHKPAIKVGFNEQEINKQINEITDKMINKEFKHLYIVGLLNYPSMDKQYFDKFFELLPDDCFAISLCRQVKKKNVFHFDSFYDYSLTYKVLSNISKKIPFNKINMSIFLTRCDKHTISNLLYLKSSGIKNVYMCKCSQALLNPALVKTLQETFGIKEMADPQKDIKETTKEG